MADLLTPTPPGGSLGQFVRWRHRRRLLSLRDLTADLFRTHALGPQAVNFVTATLFPEAASPPALQRLVTMVAEISVVTAGTASGVIIEVGGSAHGAGLIMDAGTLVGFGGDATTQGADASFALASGQRVQVAVVLSPGDGRLALFVDGRQVARAVASAGNFLTGRWAAVAEDGAVAQVNGTLSSRVTAVGVPTDFEIVSPVSVYLGQVPKGFF